jgi:hypothetical protein
MPISSSDDGRQEMCYICSISIQSSGREEGKEKERERKGGREREKGGKKEREERDLVQLGGEKEEKPTL